MLTIAQAAVLMGIKQSRIFQIVDTGATHFNEAEAGVLMICLPSLARALVPARNRSTARGSYVWRTTVRR